LKEQARNHVALPEQAAECSTIKRLAFDKIDKRHEAADDLL
jgi:hypothetical protein